MIRWAKQSGPPVRRSWRRALHVTVAAATIFAGALLFWHIKRQAPLPDLPIVDLSRLEPVKADMIREAHAAALAAPRSAPACGRYGNVLWAQDFIAEAAACYARAEQLDHQDVRWPYLRGLALERHRPDIAFECMQRAAQIADGLALPSVQLAEMLLTRGQVSEAREQFQRARKLAHGDSRVLLGLGRAAFMQGSLDEALEWTVQAAQADPRRRSIHVLLCQIYQQRGDQANVDQQLGILNALPAAVPYYEWPDPILGEVARYKHDVTSTLSQAQELIDSGRAGEAIALLRESAAARANDVRLAIMLGKAYLRAGDLTRATETLTHASQEDPTQAPVHFELGNLARATRRLDDAIGHYQEAVRLEPNYAIAHYNLGLCRYELGDRDGAISAFEEVCRAMPHNLLARRTLAKLLFECGRRDAAVAHLKEIVRLAPDDREAWQLLDRAQAADSFSPANGNDVHLQGSRDPS